LSCFADIFGNLFILFTRGWVATRKDFLNITIDDLLTVKGIGQTKALQVYSAVALIKRFYLFLVVGQL
jgi:hypothetical protein